MSSSPSLQSPAPSRRKHWQSPDRDTDASSTSDEEKDVVPPTELTVLSHAERRRQKKRQKLNQPESESPRKKRKFGDDGTPSSPPANANVKAKTSTGKKAKTKADDPTERPKRQNSVWVGNLSFRTTRDALREYFDGVGTITRVHMPMGRRGGDRVQTENMGFAYVDFETPGAKSIAIALSEGLLDGRHLLIKDGDDFTGRPETTKKDVGKKDQTILAAQKQPPAPTLFLGNLGFETTEESIRALFEAHRYGKQKDKGKDKGVDVKPEAQEGGDTAKSKDVWIRKIRMGTFEDSGACKGFAFVDFTSIEHATEALVNRRNHHLDGRDLVVEYASPDAVRRGGGPRYPKEDHDQKSKSGSKRVAQKGSVNTSHTKRPQPKQEPGDNTQATGIPVETTATPHSRQPDRVGHARPHARRSRPGAALAHAQRQSVAILPSQGQKIVF